MSEAGDILGTMRTNGMTRRALSFGGIAAAGVVLGHWLAYDLALPHAGQRAGVLGETGHSYWLLAVRTAIVLGLAGAGAVVARHARSTPGRGTVERYAESTLRLAALQVAGFAAMEVAERLLAGAPLGSMFTHHVFVVGLAVQFLVACAGGLAVVVLSRAGRRIALALRRRVPLQREASLPEPGPAPAIPRLLLGGDAGVRGPPPLPVAS